MLLNAINVWYRKNIIRGRFYQVIPLAYEYAYLHAHTSAMQIRPYSIHIEDT